MKKASITYLFNNGIAQSKDVIYFILLHKKFAAEDIPHGLFALFKQGEANIIDKRKWAPAAACIIRQPKEKLVVIGSEGEVFTYDGVQATDEMIIPSPIALRAVSTIEGFPLACGMGGQVYKRVEDDTWIAMHPPKEADIYGFEDINGFNLQEIYAVGWRGEIWQWDGLVWLSRNSPIDLILTGLCCVQDEYVYVCGQEGTLIRGRQDRWEIINLEGFEEDFWDVLWFNDKLYLATMSNLYTFTTKGLELVNFGEDYPNTCYRLTEANGTLWSIGESDIFSFDGNNWSRVG